MIVTVSELDQVVTNVVNRCIELCSENSTTGNWVVDHDDLADLISYEDYVQYFGFIAEELGSREEVLDLDYSDTRLDIILGIAWLKNYVALDDSEEEQTLEKSAGEEEIKPLMSMTQTISYLTARVETLQKALGIQDGPDECVQCPCCGKAAWYSDYDSGYHCGCCNASIDLRKVLGK